MTLTFQKELFINIMPELPKLFVEHFKIVKDPDYKKLDIDWGKYVTLETNNLLHILTVRDGDRLVGYFFNLCMPHILYRDILHGFGDIYFLLPEYRKWFAGVRMIKENAKMLKNLGCTKQCVSINSGMSSIIKLFYFLGYKPWETIVTKRL